MLLKTIKVNSVRGRDNTFFVLLTGAVYLQSGDLKNSTLFESPCISTTVLIADTILRLLLETITPFYVVILTTWRPSRLQEKGGTLISQWKTQSIGPAPESNQRPPGPQSSAPPTGVNLPRLSSAVFYMFFRHVLNNKSTRCTILQVTIFLEFIRKYIILRTLNLKLTKPHTEGRRKKPPPFTFNVYPAATQLMVKHFSLIYTCLVSSSGAPSPSSLSLRLLLLLVPGWSWILGKQIQDSKAALITRGGRGTLRSHASLNRQK